MQKTTCSVSECASPPKARGWCEKHYYRWYRYGSVHTTSRIVGDDAARFWAKVDRSGDCHVWVGARDAFGYGLFLFEGRSTRAHAHSLGLSEAGGRPAGKLALHRCDNPPCVNPAHLYWGTHQQNSNDMTERDRSAHGERRPQARLTEEDVVSLRYEYARGEEVPTLASRYGIKEPTVRSIVIGNKWKRAGGPITRRALIKSREKKIG